ncbi:MAG: DNA (cytosine-5-)-methyltransferase [Methanobrevibacter sp.]|uniref:DNA cytosine methyltransferase n=1 Tax=Methanobrevibacter sp. TaxID=66852 RepID=UPI0026DFD6EC|nr:DNA (cytosine-5-)-methyltransferase [Methanobrevibacter sp.]MDO5849113.1 DNA (cytosine-5-)-methyltransferase [Methanobrevibacter sp.]
MKGASMFSSAGIAETYFKEAGIDICVANELIPKRAKFYQEMYPDSNMIVGDIREREIKDEFIESIDDDVKFLIATPPCQGLSTLGMNKHLDQMQSDPRNYLVFDILDVIDKKDFDYILIENVSRFLTMYFPYKDSFYKLEEILKDLYSDKYNVEAELLNAKDYGIPQSRPRAIIKMFKKGKKWDWPETQSEITLKEAIGDLPSLESEEISSLKHHYARKHTENHINWMKHTPTGHSAHENKEHFPVKKNGEKVKGFKSTYKRMRWDAPAPAVTMRSDAISSQENVHPGRKLSDGTYSDARVLTLRELFIVSSLPEDWNIPEWTTDTFMRQIIGEGVPPELSYKIVKGIDQND